MLRRRNANHCETHEEEVALDILEQEYRPSRNKLGPLILPFVCDAAVGSSGREGWSVRKRNSWCKAVVFILSVFLFGRFISSPHMYTYDASRQMYLAERSELLAMIVIKDESHILVEFLLHLLSQGYTLLLIDNMSNSTRFPREEIRLFEEEGLLTYIQDPATCCVQTTAYLKGVFQLNMQLAMWHGFWRNKVDEWIMPVDADEFPVAPSMGSLRNYLVLQKNEVCSVLLPWRIFGSSGKIEQPNSVLHGFLHRGNDTLAPLPEKHYKTVTRLRCLLLPTIHRSFVWPWYVSSSYIATTPQPTKLPLLQSPRIDNEKNSYAAWEAHYRIQSHNFYRDIKMTRGNAFKTTRVRSESSFEFGDHNHIEDAFMKELSQKRFPSLYGSSTDEGLALAPNKEYGSPWPLESVKQALRQVARHQALVVIDGVKNMGDSSRLDALRRAVHNAALLDPTWDCLVRIQEGDVASAFTFKLNKLCSLKVVPSDEVSSFESFVADEVQSSDYSAYAVLENAVSLTTPCTVTSAFTNTRNATQEKKTSFQTATVVHLVEGC